MDACTWIAVHRRIKSPLRMLLDFLPDSSKVGDDVASGFRTDCIEGERVCGSAGWDIKVESESADIDFGRKKRGRLNVRGTRSSRNVGGSREESSGTEPRRKATRSPTEESEGGKPSSRGGPKRGWSDGEGTVEGRNDLRRTRPMGDIGDGGECNVWSGRRGRGISSHLRATG